MTLEERYKIVSNDFTDLFIEYNRNLNFLDRFPDASTQIIDNRFAVAYVPNEQLNNNIISKFGYPSLPFCYGLTSQRSLESSEVLRIRRIPKLNLTGQGVLIGIIDTGIDYTNPIFIKKDGTSKVARLWDQTINEEGVFFANTLFGTEYNNEQMNQALRNSNSYDIVPSVDEIGHGTMLAGIAVGNEVPEEQFAGVVPDAELIVVKLKQAKPALRKFNEIPLDVPCYQENDIIWALDYVRMTARIMNRPISMCIGLGTSQGSHDGKGPLNKFIYSASLYPKTTITISAGNEGNNKRHFFSRIDTNIGYSGMELKVGEKESGFLMEIWGAATNTYSIDIMSPTGEYTPRIAESLNTNRKISYIFDKTTIQIDYQLVQAHMGDQLILLRFHNPAPGIWKFNVYTRGDLAGAYHAWLPMGDFMSLDTFFVQPDPYTTITGPGDTETPITVTAYNPENNSLYLEASRGYTRGNIIKPELAAPGVNVIAPTLERGFTRFSGTGIAAAHTAGIAAMILQWAKVQGNYPEINTTGVKEYLIRGAERTASEMYPNREWGYGILDIYGVFDILSRSN